MSPTDMKEAPAAAVDAAALAQRAVEHLKKRGAKESAVVVEKRRSLDIEVREQKVEKLQESNSAALAVAVYADGRYSSHSTSDLAWPSLEKFLDGALAMTRVLEPDGFRSLPDPRWYAGQAKLDLALADGPAGAFDAAAWKKAALAIEAAARASGGVKGAGGEEATIQSASAEVGESRGERVRATSNGFLGREESTGFYGGASVTMREGMKRPEDYWYISSRKRADLGAPEALGAEAAARAKGRVGARKVAGGAMSVLIENRQAGRLLGYLVGAASAPSLQQKRSFLEGKLGKKVTSPKLTITDDPHIAGALGSRLFDGEGIAARRMPFIEGGVLKSYFVDWYYGRKLGMDPTTGGPSNLVVAPGSRSLEEMVKSIDRGILVTSFLGGNSNGLTGDFSVGIQGILIEKGARTTPVGEMNLAGNHTEFWDRVAEVGSDVWRFSSTRAPSILLDGVSVAGA